MSLAQVWATRDVWSYSVQGPLNSTKTHIWRTAGHTKFYNHLNCLKSSTYGVFLLSTNTFQHYKMHFWVPEPLNTTEYIHTDTYYLANDILKRCNRRMIFYSALKF